MKKINISWFYLEPSKMSAKKTDSKKVALKISTKKTEKSNSTKQTASIKRVAQPKNDYIETIITAYSKEDKMLQKIEEHVDKTRNATCKEIAERKAKREKLEKTWNKIKSELKWISKSKNKKNLSENNANLDVLVSQLQTQSTEKATNKNNYTTKSYSYYFILFIIICLVIFLLSKMF